MAIDTTNSVAALLSTLTQYLTTSNTLVPPTSTVQAPEHGLSLLDTKNELFLAYLQNLVFLILVKLRHRSKGPEEKEDGNLDEQITRKLIEFRVYLERGVRKLETDLSYQINKVLQAAEDATRAHALSDKSVAVKKAKTASSNEDNQENDEDATGGVQITDLQYRPNPSAFSRPTRTTTDYKDKWKEGVYKPPRINAVAMPLPSSSRANGGERKVQRSATMQEYIDAEYSAQPLPEPSIGSGILRSGRGLVEERERREEWERREYEEENFVRLPTVTKKERREKQKRDGGGRMGYGGEEWRELSRGVDRIEKLTAKRGVDGGRTREILEKSRKRKADDAGMGGGIGIGQGFRKGIQTLDAKRRKRANRK